MPACCRFFLNLFRPRKPVSLPEDGPRGQPINAHQRQSVGSINPSYCGASAMKDDNQNNAFSASPMPITSQPVPQEGYNDEDQDPVRMTVIALPGPGVNIPYNPTSCPPLDVTQEIEGLDTATTITENSDSEWVDRRNKAILQHSISMNSLSDLSD